jgi:excisionase family DNA binding protein
MPKTKKTAKPRPRSERLHQMDSEIVDVAGAAALLGVSKTAIYGLLKKGELPARKIGKEWRFTRKNLLAYVGSVTTAPSDNVDEMFKAAQDRAKLSEMLKQGKAHPVAPKR